MTKHRFKWRWSHVDDSGQTDQYVSVLNRVRPGDDPAAFPATLEWIDARPGERILEVGCGNGAVARAVAKQEPGIRELIGIDASAAMIAEARRQTVDTRLPVRFEIGDAHHLPFPDNVFDRVYAMETFVILPDPHQAFMEMGRVTCPGGTVCWRESDLEAHALLASDLSLERRLMRFVADEEYNGAVARQIVGWCKNLGWDVTVAPAIGVSEDGSFLLTSLLPEWLADAQAADVLTAEEAARFLSDLTRRQTSGLFFSYTVDFRIRAKSVSERVDRRNQRQADAATSLLQDTST